MKLGPSLSDLTSGDVAGLPSGFVCALPVFAVSALCCTLAFLGGAPLYSRYWGH